MNNQENPNPEFSEVPSQKKLWDFIDQSGVFNPEQRGQLIRESENNPGILQAIMDAYRAEKNYKSGGKILLEQLRDWLKSKDNKSTKKKTK